MKTAETCVANIGPGERRRRRIISVAAFSVAAAVALGLSAIGAPRAWRLLSFVPLWVGALCFFEAQARTCVVLAARGLRNMGAGNERIGSPEDLRRLMRQSRRVHVQTLLLSAALTAALLSI